MAVIFDPTMSNLEDSIRRAQLAQEVTSQNIANANTPGYIPKKFDDVLNKAIERQDKKGVNIEEEMAQLSVNEQRHSSCIRLLTTKLSMLRTIISQGRK